MWSVALAHPDEIDAIAEIESECLLDRYGPRLSDEDKEACSPVNLRERWQHLITAGETDVSAVYVVDQNETLTGYARCGRNLDPAFPSDGIIHEYEIRPRRRSDEDTATMLLSICRRRLKALGCTTMAMWVDSNLIANAPDPSNHVLRRNHARFGIITPQHLMTWKL
jgi:hypothetical protein